MADWARERATELDGRIADIIRREEVQAIMAACSRCPHPDEPGRAATNIIREIERIVAEARDRTFILAAALEADHTRTEGE